MQGPMNTTFASGSKVLIIRPEAIIGDTEGDSKACIDAGVPFVFMTYGFGKTDNYELKFDSFSQLTDYFLKL